MLKELDVSQDAMWKKRFRVPVIGWSTIATQNPERGLVCTNRDGVFQLYAWDIPTGYLKQLTHHSAGVVAGVISADGERVYFLDDKDGNEVGHFRSSAIRGRFTRRFNSRYAGLCGVSYHRIT